MITMKAKTPFIYTDFNYTTIFSSVSSVTLFKSKILK